MQDTTPAMYDEIMYGDIFSVFNLKNYKTSLQKKKFLETEEGQYYSEQLKKLKTSLKGNNQCGLIEWRIREFTYDLNLGGFLIPIGKNYSNGQFGYGWSWDETDQGKGMFHGIYCNNINENLVIEKVDGRKYEDTKSYYLLWKCDENLALEIEKNGAIIWYQFSIVGIRANTFDIYSKQEPSGFLGRGSYYEIDDGFIKTWNYEDLWRHYSYTYKNQLTVRDLKITLVNPETYKNYGVNYFSGKNDLSPASSKITESVSEVSRGGRTFVTMIKSGTKNSSNTLSGTYMLSRMTDDGMTVSKNGTSITINSLTITKKGSTYAATMYGLDVTAEAGGSEALGDTFGDIYYEILNLSCNFKDRTVTLTIPGEGIHTGTYTVNGNTALVTMDGDTMLATTSDGWRTFSIRF